MGETPAFPEEHRSTFTRALLISVFVIATCGLIYELLAGTVASYLLGDSVTQFSTIIGVYLFSMGLGSFLSRYIQGDLLSSFIQIEILVGLIGGLSSAVLFLAFAEVSAFRVVLYSWVMMTGILVGLEIPLLLRILEKQFAFQDLVSAVLSLDYLGALAASLLFPLWLVPKVGLMRSSFVFGVLNIVVAVWACHLFREFSRRQGLTLQAYGSLGILLLGVAFSDELTSWTEKRLYNEPIIFAETSPYQRVVLTRNKKGEVRLYLSGELQLSSLDEYRYHEALVHPGLLASEAPRRVLVLGGGDGMAVREVLKDERVSSVTLVDLDPTMTEIFRDHEELAALNDYALRSPKVKIENADAFIWLDENKTLFDAVFVDFPDPWNYSLGKLYTTTFYHRLAAHLAPGAIVAVQASSPLWSRRSFWCIVKTLGAVGFETTPYRTPVPSFGEWGFVLASLEPLRAAELLQERRRRLPAGLRYLTPGVFPSLFEFPADMAALPVEVNRLNNQILVQYQEEDLGRLLE